MQILCDIVINEGELIRDISPKDQMYAFDKQRPVF